MRLVSLNVHKFFDLFNRKYFLLELKKYLAELNLDFVFLQEVRGVHPKSFDSLQAPLEHLADGIWTDYAYGKNAAYSSGHHGNAILSKYPLRSWNNIDLTNHKFERRGMLLAEPDIPGAASMLLACTHLDLTGFGRTRQVGLIREQLGLVDPTRPVVLAGDFNDWTFKVSRNLRALPLYDSFADCSYRERSSFPAAVPFLCLDRVFFRNLSVKRACVLNEAHWRALSDHLPLLVEFDLP